MTFVEINISALASMLITPVIVTNQIRIPMPPNSTAVWFACAAMEAQSVYSTMDYGSWISEGWVKGRGLGIMPAPTGTSWLKVHSRV